MIISVLNWKFNDFHVMLPKPSRLQHLASVQSGAESGLSFQLAAGFVQFQNNLYFHFSSSLHTASVTHSSLQISDSIDNQRNPFLQSCF